MDDFFWHYYRCYPISLTGKHDHLENSDKILMPLSVLDLLLDMEIEYPMMFELTNPREEGKVCHCGVMEFSSDEGKVLLPEWMMSTMNFEEGDLIVIKSVSLDKGTFVKLRPHETAFMELSDPKVVLEKTLRQFSCLTVGETIAIDYNDKKFLIDVLETKPDPKAVSIFDVDCEVDFAPALDYKEPEKEKEKATVVAEKMKPGHLEEKAGKEEIKFTAFAGVGRRLNGKSSGCSTKEFSSSTSGEKCDSESTKEVNCGGGKKSDIESTKEVSTTTNGGMRKAGKLVFGSSDAVKNLVERSKVRDDKRVDKVKDKENDFRPFSGKSYKLKH